MYLLVRAIFGFFSSLAATNSVKKDFWKRLRRDGIFSNPKILIWVTLEDLAMEDVGIFYDIWSYGCCGNSVYFPVLLFCTKKNLATLILRSLQSFPDKYLRT
jgi:hypothetical protein